MKWQLAKSTEAIGQESVVQSIILLYTQRPQNTYEYNEHSGTSESICKHSLVW